MEPARMDLDTSHATTQFGVHTAAMAGTWLGLVYGFAGLRAYDGNVQFSPSLPEGWDHYRFKLRIRGRLLQVYVGRDTTEYRLLEGDALALGHHDRSLPLT